MKSVVAAEVAALAAWRILAVGDRIGALIFDDQHLHHYAPRRSRESVLRILKRLETANASLISGAQAHPEQLNLAYENLLRHVGHNALVLYVGDGFGWDERTDEILKRIALHNDVIGVNISDPAERALRNG